MTDDTTDRATSDASTNEQTPTSEQTPASEQTPTSRRSTAKSRDSTGRGRPADSDGPIAGNEGDTSSPRARFWLTNDVLAFLLVISFVGVVVGAALGRLDLAAVPVEMRLAYLTVSGGAAVWTFGQPAYRTWAEARRGGGRTAGACACCCSGGPAVRSAAPAGEPRSSRFRESDAD